MTSCYETESDIQESFRNAGVSISSDQLRRWRNQGLMPPVKQIGMGRGAGSAIHYPSGTASLALNIQRLLAIKKKASFVGWQLWLYGHEVADEHWKPAIYSALAELRRIPAFLRLWEMKNPNKDETIFDQVTPIQFRNTPFSRVLAKLSPDTMALAFGLIADVAKGNFADVHSADHLVRPEHDRAISKLIGKVTNVAIAGIIPKSAFNANLNIQLIAISDALAKIQRHPLSILSQLTPQARGEFAMVLQIAGALSSEFREFRKGPIGRFAMAIAGDQNAQAYGVAIWCIFRNMGTILDAKQIIEMAENIRGKAKDLP